MSVDCHYMIDFKQKGIINELIVMKMLSEDENEVDFKN